MESLTPRQLKSAQTFMKDFHKRKAAEKTYNLERLESCKQDIKSGFSTGWWSIRLKVKTILELEKTLKTWDEDVAREAKELEEKMVATAPLSTPQLKFIAECMEQFREDKKVERRGLEPRIVKEKERLDDCKGYHINMVIEIVNGILKMEESWWKWDDDVEREAKEYEKMIIARERKVKEPTEMEKKTS